MFHRTMKKIDQNKPHVRSDLFIDLPSCYAFRGKREKVNRIRMYTH